MKKCLIPIFATLILFSCKDNDKGTPAPEKKIDRAVICFSKPFISKNESILIGVRYFKNYTQTDQVQLKLNGVSGVMTGPRVFGIRRH